MTSSLTAWRGNQGAIGFYAIILLLLFAGLGRISVVLVALFFSGSMPSLTTFIQHLVFAVSVISIPLMMDHGTDAITAMIASILALARNFPEMLIWALLIVSLTFVGLATLYAGHAITAPPEESPRAPD